MPNTPIQQDGTILEGHAHPAAHSAFAYVKARLLADPMLIDSFASTALSGNDMAEVCSSTIRRMMDGEPVSDRYVLGLAWALKQMEKAE